jgi:hypothetical protein
MDVTDQPSDYRARTAASRWGYWASLVTTGLTVLALGLAITTLPRSGPSCAFDTCVTYPYTDIAEFFPRDYYWMVPATLLLFPFVLQTACIHVWVEDQRKPLSLAALAFAVGAGAILFADYFTQLTVIQPSVERGEFDGLSLFSQYNPHGVFIALEAVGYSLMSLSLLCMAAALTQPMGLIRAVRWLGAGAFGLSVIGLLALAAIYGNDLEYRFEILVISVNWVALVGIGGLMSLFFRRAAGAGGADAA